MLLRLRTLFSMPKGPRLRVVDKQNELFGTSTRSLMLPDLRLEVKAKRFGNPPMTIDGAVLQLILMTCAGRLFVQREFVCSLELIDLKEAGPVAHVSNDMFQRVAGLRRVNVAFYIASLDIWPALQEEFVKSMAAFIKSKPVMTLRMPVDCVAEIMKVLDPSLSRQWDDQSKRWISVLNQDAVADALRLTFHEKLKRHLRYHSAIQLMILFSNDITIIDNGSVLKGLVIPTLSGFAAHLGISFGFIISQAIRDYGRNEAISLFYEREAPAWNMLPDEHGTKNLQEYLESISVMEGKRSKLMPAPVDLFAGAWPQLPEIGSLNTYIFGGEEQCMPPIRKVELKVSDSVPTVKLEIVAEIILPMRLLLYAKNRTTIWTPADGQTTWTYQFNSYTMNVTTDMLAQCTWHSEMPADFQVMDHIPEIISREEHWLPDGSPLTGHKFKIWADVMLTWTAHNGDDPNNNGDPYRQRMEELPLFSNFMQVANSIKNNFPAFNRDIYVDADFLLGDVPYEGSPIQEDWGTTSWVRTGPDDLIHTLDLDAEFIAQFDNNAPSSRKSWTTTSFFDMSLSFMKQNRGLNAEDFSPKTVFTVHSIKNTIWKERLGPEDIIPLMTHASLWPRHTFTNAEKVVARQHALHTQANPPAVAQAPRRPPGRPLGQLSSINQTGLARRRAGFLL
jgi:hypothetical protein